MIVIMIGTLVPIGLPIISYLISLIIVGLVAVHVNYIYNADIDVTELSIKFKMYYYIYIL